MYKASTDTSLICLPCFIGQLVALRGKKATHRRGGDFSGMHLCTHHTLCAVRCGVMSLYRDRLIGLHQAFISRIVVLNSAKNRACIVL